MFSMSNVENEHSYSYIQIEHVGAQDTPESSLSSISKEHEDGLLSPPVIR